MGPGRLLSVCSGAWSGEPAVWLGATCLPSALLCEAAFPKLRGAICRLGELPAPQGCSSLTHKFWD